MTWVTKSLWFFVQDTRSLNLRYVIKTSSCHRLMGPVINLNTLFNQQSFTDRSLLTEIDCPRTDCAVLSHLELPRSMIYGFKTSYVCKVVSYLSFYCHTDDSVLGTKQYLVITHKHHITFLPFQANWGRTFTLWITLVIEWFITDSNAFLGNCLKLYLTSCLKQLSIQLWQLVQNRLLSTHLYHFVVEQVGGIQCDTLKCSIYIRHLNTYQVIILTNVPCQSPKGFIEYS